MSPKKNQKAPGKIKGATKGATGRCARCNHHIWLPESLALGMGSICRQKDENVVPVELQAEYKRLANEILNLQKKGKIFQAEKAKVGSSLSLWKKNKKLTEGW